MDTRNIGGVGMGSKLDSSSFPFTVSVTDVHKDPDNPTINVQGGQGGCDVPSDSSGIFGQFTVLSPDSGGYARLWPHGESEPLSSTINAFNSLPETTGISIRLGFDGQLHLTSTISAAHYVIDITAYTTLILTAQEAQEVEP